MTPDEIATRVAYARSLLAEIEREADQTLEIALDLATTPREASRARTERARTITGALLAYRAVLAAAL